MSFLRKLFGREEEVVEDAPIKLDVEGRRQQLQRLEQALDALATEMRAEQSMDNPGWDLAAENRANLEDQVQNSFPGGRPTLVPRVPGQPAVLVDPGPPTRIVHALLGPHLGGEGIERLLEPLQLLPPAFDVELDRDLLDDLFLATEQLAQKAHRSSSMLECAQRAGAQT